MRFPVFCVSALGGALCLSSAAAHATTFNYSTVGSAGGFSGSGQLTATSNINGSYTITGITGTGINGLIAPNGFNGNDNLLFPGTSSLLDNHGFAFTDTNGNTRFMVDLYEVGSNYMLYFQDIDGVTGTLPVSFSASPAPIPEPNTFVLLGTGLAGVAGMVRRRMKRAS